MKRLNINWTVLVFFIFYFIILQFFNDWQYRAYIDNGNVWTTFRYRVFTLPLQMLLFYFFYKWCAPLLLKNQFVFFVLSIIAFIIILEILNPVLNWIGDFFSGKATTSKNALKSIWNDFSDLHQSLQLTFVNLIAVTGFAYFMNRVGEEKIKQQLKEQNLQIELQYLRAQLHPHFFFNTMNNIYSLALYHSEKTAPIVEKLSHIMRYIIYEGQKDSIPITKEIGFLKDFVALEKIRHEEKTPISLTVQGTTDHIDVPPLLFMPLLENGFKHGFLNNDRPWLEVIMLVENNEISFEIKNSYTTSQPDNGPGIGLANLRKRLALLYPEKHKLLFQNSNGQFEVSLTLYLS